MAKPKRYQMTVANNVLLEAPIFEKHSRGTNWLAVIDVDASQPGGLSRKFMPRGRGECLYSIEQISTFDAIEFGADYTTTTGRKQRDRWYGIVIAITEGRLIVEEAPSGAKAVVRAKECRQSREERAESLKFKKQDLLAQMAKLDDEIQELETPEAPNPQDQVAPS